MEEPPHKSSPMPPVGVVQRPLLEVCAGAGAAVPLIPPLTYSQIIVSCKTAKELYKLWEIWPYTYCLPDCQAIVEH